jgi:hypothetical protein
MTRKQFIAALKKAKAIIESPAGTKGCAMSLKCFHCALREAGVHSLDYRLEGYTGKKDEWSFNRPKARVVALFDNSIAALEAKVQ